MTKNQRLGKCKTFPHYRKFLSGTISSLKRKKLFYTDGSYKADKWYKMQKPVHLSTYKTNLKTQKGSACMPVMKGGWFRTVTGKASCLLTTVFSRWGKQMSIDFFLPPHQHLLL